MTNSINDFMPMSENEMQRIDGGIITEALIAGAVALFCAGFAGGIAVGLNRANANRSHH